MIISWQEMLVAIAIISTISILTAGIIVTQASRRKLVQTVLQLEADKMILLDRIDKKSEELELKNLEGTDEFVAFLSKSREWAFEYIENVQVAMYDLKNTMESESEEEIDLAYNKLMELLPKQENEEK